MAEVAAEDWLEAYRAVRPLAEQAWIDDASLDPEITMPWGTGPGRLVIAGYTLELVTHSWDLATSIGAVTELDPELGAAMLTMAQQSVPAQPRGDDVPFGPVVPVADDPDPYSRLAGWLGRDPRASSFGPEGSEASRR